MFNFLKSLFGLNKPAQFIVVDTNNFEKYKGNNSGKALELVFQNPSWRLQIANPKKNQK